MVPSSCALNSSAGRGSNLVARSTEGFISCQRPTCAGARHALTRPSPSSLASLLACRGCRWRWQAAPPIRSPARPDLVFQSEAGEIKKSKEVHPLLLQQFGGVYDDLQLQAVRERSRSARRQGQPSSGAAVHVHGARQRRDQRVHDRRRLRLHHARHHELPQLRGGARGRARARDRPRHRAPPGAPADASRRWPASAPLRSASSPAAAISLASRTTRAPRSSAATAATRSSKPIGSARNTWSKTGYSPGHMIDVVRLLKNQELFEIAARARGEAQAARLSRRVRDATRTTTQRLREVVKAAGTS